MIKIVDDKGSTSLSRVQYVESEIGVRFPQSYVQFILPNDGCYTDPHCFLYFDHHYEKNVGSGIGSFLKMNEDSGYCEDILKFHNLFSEDLSKGLVAFGMDGGGDYICFDYRKGKDDPNPPVVYWSHEAEKGKDVSFLANNFEEFLGMLKTDEEMDELLK
jgi:hypothetical protein